MTESTAARATAKTGNPQADRAARDQAAAKAAPKAAPKAAAPKAPQPKAAAKPKAPKAEYKVPKGYTLRWPHGSYDLLKKDDKDAAGPAWWVVCTAHGQMTEVKNAKEGDAKGRKAELATWCKGDHSEAAAPAKAPAKAAAKATPAKAAPAKTAEPAK